MVDQPTQDNRVGKLATSLGKDKLLLVRLEGTEAMGELFEFRIEALSTQPDIDFNPALGQNASVHLDTVDNVGRDYGGVLTEARWIGNRGRLSAYSLVFRPWFWLLSLTSDCRIFSKKTPPDIIRQVFKDRGFANAVVDLITGEYPTLEYCVQYRETDLDFVLRLMEEYGIYYYFQFDKGDGSSPSAHYLVIADSATHVAQPGLDKVVYQPSTFGERRDTQQVETWTKRHAMVTGVFRLNDYDYEKPSADLLAKADYPYQFTHGDMELYDSPGDYLEKNDGVKIAGVSRDAQRTRYERCSGTGYAPTLTPGYSIRREALGVPDSEDGDYLILRCAHAYGSQSYETDRSVTGSASYFGNYEFAKSEIPYRMPARTAKPIIAGTQSALVVGQKGEEIDVDKEGRICVQFYWDRKKTASRRIRVAQFWAGYYRGALFTPRIGDEVMVAYEDGDPDRPLVVGSVYNGTNTVPADLPTNKTHSGILTKSSKNSNGYHMLMFDDTAGSERVKLRSQRDLMFKALRNEIRDINGSQTETVGGDETITVGSETGGGNFTLKATKQIVLKVGESSSITITEESITIVSPMIYLNP